MKELKYREEEARMGWEKSRGLRHCMHETMWSVSYLISGSELICPKWSARNFHCLRLLLLGGGLLCESVSKAHLAVRTLWQRAVKGGCWSAAHFPSVSSLMTFALCRSCEVRRLLFDLNPCPGLCNDPLGIFLLFKDSCRCYGSHLGVVFLWFLRLGSFHACWRQAIWCAPLLQKHNHPPLLPITDRFL